MTTGIVSEELTRRQSLLAKMHSQAFSYTFPEEGETNPPLVKLRLQCYHQLREFHWDSGQLHAIANACEEYGPVPADADPIHVMLTHICEGWAVQPKAHTTPTAADREAWDRAIARIRAHIPQH